MMRVAVYHLLAVVCGAALVFGGVHDRPSPSNTNISSTSGLAAFSDLCAVAAATEAQSPPLWSSFVTQARAHVAIFPLISLTSPNCPVLNFTEENATAFCPVGQKTAGNPDPGGGGAYLVAHVLLTNPLDEPIDVVTMDIDLIVAPFVDPPKGFEDFGQANALFSGHNAPGIVVPVPNADGTAVSSRTSTSPLLSLSPHGRAVYELNLCLTTCLGFLSGTSDGSIRGSPGWLGSSLPAVAPTFGKSFLNSVYYDDVDAADWFNQQRGPLPTIMMLVGTANVTTNSSGLNRVDIR
jgi:hypothetical protein